MFYFEKRKKNVGSPKQSAASTEVLSQFGVSVSSFQHVYQNYATVRGEERKKACMVIQVTVCTLQFIIQFLMSVPFNSNKGYFFRGK